MGGTGRLGTHHPLNARCGRRRHHERRDMRFAAGAAARRRRDRSRQDRALCSAAAGRRSHHRKASDSEAVTYKTRTCLQMKTRFLFRMCNLSMAERVGFGPTLCHAADAQIWHPTCARCYVGAPRYAPDAPIHLVTSHRSSQPSVYLPRTKCAHHCAQQPSDTVRLPERFGASI